MMKRLVGQYNIIGKAALSSLAPALARLGLVLLGILLGLIWAYQFDPVKFYDAEPVHMADGYKDQWIKMTAREYANSGDAEEAARKIVDGGVTPDMINDLIADNQASDPQLASQLQALLPLAQSNEAAASDQADKVETGGLSGLLGPLACLFGAAVIGLLLSLVLTFYWVPPIGKWAKRGAGGARQAVGTQIASGSTHQERLAAQKQVADQKTDFAAVGEEPPVGQWMSTFVAGDELYDDSFSIETDSGDFLGECGSGISEKIGVGEPAKVTATEVWVFDKNDIRTVTKVLMSQHAYNDQALRTKLAPKGEAVLVEPNMVTTLETQTLRLQVRVVDMKYGEGPLPPNSHFERLTVEVAAWPKEDAGAGGQPGGPGGAQPTDPSAAFGDTAELLNY
jgi:hypothetical protein